MPRLRDNDAAGHRVNAERLQELIEQHRAELGLPPGERRVARRQDQEDP